MSFRKAWYQSHIAWCIHRRFSQGNTPTSPWVDVIAPPGKQGPTREEPPEYNYPPDTTLFADRIPRTDAQEGQQPGSNPTEEVVAHFHHSLTRSLSDTLLAIHMIDIFFLLVGLGTARIQGAVAVRDARRDRPTSTDWGLHPSTNRLEF